MEDDREVEDQAQATPARAGGLDGENDLLAEMDHLLSDPRWRGPITRSVRRSMTREGLSERRELEDQSPSRQDLGTALPSTRPMTDPWLGAGLRAGPDEPTGGSRPLEDGAALPETQKTGPPPGFKGPPETGVLRQAGGDPFSRAVGGLPLPSLFAREEGRQDHQHSEQGDTKTAAGPPRGALAGAHPPQATNDRKPTLTRSARFWGDLKAEESLPRSRREEGQEEENVPPTRDGREGAIHEKDQGAMLKSILAVLEGGRPLPTHNLKFLQGEKPLEERETNLPRRSVPTCPAEGTGLAGAGVRKPIIVPGKYDGATDLGEYLSHFDLCIRANGWAAAQAGMFLGLSLTGVARRLLTDVEPATEEGYWTLRAALERRFQPPNQVEMYKALLRARKRRKDEPLQSFGEDVLRLTRLSYPVADAGTTDSMARDHFLDGLKEQKLRHFIFQSKPKCLQDAVASGLEAEAFLQADTGAAEQGCVRAAGTTMGEQLQALSEQFAVMREDLKTAKGASQERPYRPRQKGACYRCHKEGHIRINCPEPPNESDRRWEEQKKQWAGAATQSSTPAPVQTSQKPGN